MSGSSDSEDDFLHSNDDQDTPTPESSVNLAGFLFGNIDREGKLEDSSLLDDQSKQKLNGLMQILGGSNINDLIGGVLKEETNDDANDDADFSNKAPGAEDFSSITEALSDESSSSDSETDDKDDKSEVKLKEEIKEEPVEDESDQRLMPPPPSVPSNRSPVPPHSVKDEVKDSRKPLAGMLPEKYKNIDVKELFPEFRHNSVLRFSRLFPIKASHKPRIWKGLKRKKKKEKEEDDEEPQDKKSRGWAIYAEYPDDPDAYEEDDHIRYLRPVEKVSQNKTETDEKEKRSKGPKPTDWRWGPAQYWYDMLDLPDEPTDFDYGLKEAIENIPDQKKDEPAEEAKDDSETKSKEKKIEIPEEAYFMVTQLNWEEDVIWNGEDIKHKVLQKLNSKTNAAGWVPSSFNRTAGTFSQPGSKAAITGGIKLQTMQHKKPESADDTWYSIFPVENEELVYGRWEDEVIWDSENVPRKMTPKMVSLDPNDDNMILGIPDDIDPSTLQSDQPVRKVKVIQKHVKKSRMLLNRSGIISVIEEESPPPPPKVDDKDPFNVSNDEFYAPKTQENLIKVATGGTLLQHATPVVELQAPFVPTHMGPIKLRLFHRPPLKRFSHGPLANTNNWYGVMSLQKHMKKKARSREAEREAAGGGEIFFMRTPEDLSGKDGEIILIEYMEEHPPLLSLVGMASKIKNYYKRKPGSSKDSDVKFRYGESCLAHTSPFLGQMTPGQTIQAMENNLFRSPIYEHQLPHTDFIVIRTRNEFSIREADGLFVAGQECPLYEVPGPNSKRANNFTRDFLQVFIYRLFWKSRDNPRRIKMDEIKRAFPAHSESSIRKRLKPCAQFHRTGHDSNWWVIKPNFRLPTEDEMRAMVNPEQCCSFFSMIAAEQRLRDAGYGEKFLLAQQEDDDEETAMKMDDEVKCAPWNTTRAYILAMKGKCLLQLTGPADPTGPVGEGFSYVRIPNKPTNKEDQEQQPKRTVTGTDADLRKLPLKDARAILRSNGVPEDEIKKLSRWEVIDVVRTLSTEKVKAGEDGDHKFSRGNRFSIAEHQERYREECQRLFETQNRVLASDEILSSEEGESSEEEDVNDDDLDEMGKNLENLLQNKKTSSQFLREREELERRNLQKMIMGDNTEDSTPSKKKKDDDDQSVTSNGPPKVLRITRTFKNEKGHEYTRTELVRKPLVIETYMKVRETKDEAFIKQFATLDESMKEEMKKEKRRLQEQLRRIKRNQEKERLGIGQKSKKRKEKPKPDLKLKCGACGAKGHMRTNKACPKFVPEFESDPVKVALTMDDEEELEKELTNVEGTEELVNVDGTKVKLSGVVLKHAEEIRRKSMILKVPKNAMKLGQKRRRAGTVEHCDYLSNKNYRPAKRRRTDPLITFATFLENVHSELRSMDEAVHFMQPVPKKLTNYYEMIAHPMDLQTVRENIQKKKYHSRAEFLADINQIKENSATFNGVDDILTVCAKRLLDRVIKKFSEKEETLMRLEKAINPLLDDNHQVAFTYVLESILNEHIKTMQESWPFMKPVNKKLVKGYYDVITEPMDLETISNKVKNHAYHSRKQFLYDIELLHTNSAKYNGETSEYTAKAKRVLDVARETMVPYNDHLSELEQKIEEIQQRALENADDESSSFGPEFEQAKPKRGRPRKNRKKNPISSEFIDVGSEAQSPNEDTGLLEDDLQYSDDEDDEEWMEVDEENTNFTVTVDSTNQSMDSTAQSDAAAALMSMSTAGGAGTQQMGYYQETQQPVDIVYHDDVQVDENYDPTDFLHSLGGSGGVGGAGVALGGAGVAQEELNVSGASGVDIKDDLNISDSDEEGEIPEQVGHHQPEPPPPDEDGIWF